MKNKFHSIDQESTIDEDFIKQINKLEKSIILVQSLFDANNHFIELMNILLNLQTPPYVFIPYMAYGHRYNKIKQFIINSIKHYSKRIISLDLNKPDKNIYSISIIPLFSKHILKNKSFNQVLIAIDNRSLKITKTISQNTQIPFVFINKHDEKIHNLKNKHLIIIDDVLYTGKSLYNTIDKCKKYKKIEVYMTHILGQRRKKISFWDHEKLLNLGP